MVLVSLLKVHASDKVFNKTSRSIWKSGQFPFLDVIKMKLKDLRLKLCIMICWVAGKIGALSKGTGNLTGFGKQRKRWAYCMLLVAVCFIFKGVRKHLNVVWGFGGNVLGQFEEKKSCVVLSYNILKCLKNIIGFVSTRK